MKYKEWDGKVDSLPANVLEYIKTHVRPCADCGEVVFSPGGKRKRCAKCAHAHALVYASEYRKTPAGRKSIQKTNGMFKSLRYQSIVGRR